MPSIFIRFKRSLSTGSTQTDSDLANAGCTGFSKHPLATDPIEEQDHTIRARDSFDVRNLAEIE